MLKKMSIDMGKALYNCAKTVSHARKTHTDIKKPTAQQLLDEAREWEKDNPDFTLPPGKSVISPLRNVPEQCRGPSFIEAEKKKNRTPEEELLDLAYGDEHNI